MDFELTEEQKMLRSMARDFAVKELEPIAAKVDEESMFPTDNVKKMAELGFLGIGFPEELGGSGGGHVELCIVTEEICKVCASTGTILLASTGLAGHPLYVFGNEEQRKRVVSRVARGDTMACFGLTEANAGSDAGALETTATRKDGGYVLNGTKIFITNGAEAGVAIVFATVDKALKHKGISAFIVEAGTPGYSVGKHEHKLGIRGSSTTELIFDNCFIPESNRVGKEGEGLRIALDAIDASRITVAAQAVGIAQGALEKCLAYAKERQQFGQPIANFQAIQWMLADMATQIEAARLLTLRAAYLFDRGESVLKASSMAKVFAAEVAQFVTTKAIQIYGGYGFVKEYPIERYFRDAKITEIYEGTSEMQRMTIARQLIRES